MVLIILLHTLQLNPRPLLSIILCEELFTVIQSYDNHELNLLSLHIWRNNYAIIFVNRFNKLLLNFICRAFKAPKLTYFTTHYTATSISRLQSGASSEEPLFDQIVFSNLVTNITRTSTTDNIRKRESVKSFSLFELSNQVFCCFK